MIVLFASIRHKQVFGWRCIFIFLTWQLVKMVKMPLIACVLNALQNSRHNQTDSFVDYHRLFGELLVVRWCIIQACWLGRCWWIQFELVAIVLASRTFMCGWKIEGDLVSNLVLRKLFVRHAFELADSKWKTSARIEVTAIFCINIY